MKRHAWGPRALTLLLATASLATAAHAETATYTYDTLGRLKTVAWSSGATTTYSYDANDNRTSLVTTGGQNSNPVAVSDTKTTYKNLALSFDPRANDTDPNDDALTVTAKTDGAHGTVSITGGGTGLTFTPVTNYTGSDSFTYSLSDGHSGTASGTVNVTIADNSVPVANGDSITVTKNVAYSFNPRSNDTDADSDPITIVSKTDGAHGTVSITGGGTGLTFTPVTNYTGSDSFTYTISDGKGGSSTGTVSATVQAPALFASVNSSTWVATKDGSDPPIYDPTAVCSGSGGSGTYTYAWARVSGDTSTTATAPSSSSTSWSRSFVGFNTWTSVWRCTVTDSASATASADVTVTFSHE